ncbi:hypothetical protein EK904_005050 [Melospiza melodia maxima]|nr:hypothetical protein EK904_005050 [Melospiza melodia maxima]
MHKFQLGVFTRAEFTAMRDQYMRGGEGFIICYSITDRQSFQEAAEFKELIYRVRHTYDIPVVLVGNKIDLEEFRQIIGFLPKSGCDKTLVVTIQLQFNRGYKHWCQNRRGEMRIWGRMWVQLFC